MSTIKSSDEHLTLNADGSSKDIKFQANGVEKASISSAGVMTATSFAGSGAALTGVGVAGISSSADATAITIDSSEQVGIGVAPSDHTLSIKSVDNTANVLELASGDSQTKLNFSRSGAPTAYVRMYEDGSTGSGALYFGTGTSSSPADTLKIGSNGNLEVGNTSTNESFIKITDHDTSAYIGAESSACCVGMNSSIASANNLMIYADGRGLSQFTAKAWIQMDMSNMSINDSHNFSSVTDITTGQARCNYSNALGSTTPAIATSGPDGYISGTSNINSTSFYLRSGDSNWSAADTNKNMAIVFAD